MKLMKLVALLATGLLLSIPAQASNLGYTMLGIDLTRTEFDEDIDVGAVSFSNTGGAKLYGSYQFNENFFVMLSGQGEKNKDGGFEISSSLRQIGGGFAVPVGSLTDIVASLTLVSVEDKKCQYIFNYRSCDKVDDDGYGTSIGIRHLAMNTLEFNAAFSKIKLHDFDDRNTVTIGGALWFAKHHSFRLTLGDTDDARTAALGYRYTF